MRKLLLASFGVMLLVCSLVAVAQTPRDQVIVPTGKGTAVAQPAASVSNGFTTVCSSGICYHGGPIMLRTPHIYFIWYGTWDGSGAHGTNTTSDSPATQTLLDNLITGLNGSPYEHIETTYYNASNAPATGLLHLGSSTADAYSQGSTLSDASIKAIVAAHAGVDLPLDGNGIYFVLTSSDVNETSGFCNVYCGWHTHGSINGRNLKYAFVGNPDRCPSACEAQATSPNNDSGGDGMANIISHEQEEAITDPVLNAWYDTLGRENADKCAWKFGFESTAANGSKYDVVLNGTQYLIQKNWVHSGNGYCSMRF